MIHLQDINKTYQGAQPLHVLKGISLDIAKGEFVSIMGASGSGKSTLLNILGILDNYDSGTYELAGVPIWNLSERKAAEYRNKMIGFIFQSFNLISFKTAVENVELPLFYQGVNRKKRHQMALEYLERLGLLDWAEHYPNELSGGQKQRVAIARALITRDCASKLAQMVSVSQPQKFIGFHTVHLMARLLIGNISQRLYYLICCIHCFLIDAFCGAKIRKDFETFRFLRKKLLKPFGSPIFRSFRHTQPS